MDSLLSRDRCKFILVIFSSIDSFGFLTSEQEAAVSYREDASLTVFSGDSFLLGQDIVDDWRKPWVTWDDA